jgi:uncharacterized protein YeaO (DUF488 family)
VIKIKHFMDAVDADDGSRAWVEPIRLTRDLQEWCAVDEVLRMLGPPQDLWAWHADHGDAYDVFRARYHEWLARSPYRRLLQALAGESLRSNFTLLHAGDDPEHNCAAALKDFLAELAALCPRDD